MECQAKQLLSLGMTLGEGPVWVGDTLWFVDIKQQHVFRYMPDTTALDRWDAPETVGWVLPTSDGALLAGLKSGLYRFDPANGAFTSVTAVEIDRPGNRLNDAAIDPSGRLWFGTMDNGETAPTGELYRWHRGTLTHAGVPPTVITNGPAITPDGRRLYHVDTLAGAIHTYAIDKDGTLGTGRLFVTIDPAEGHPDGAIADADGGVWVGMYGGWAARRYDAAGQLTDVVRFPVANVTKIALGGEDGRTAFATTARQGLSDEALAAQPRAGDVFTFRVDIPGAPTGQIEL